MLYIHEMEGKFKVFFFFFSNSKFWGDIRGGRKKKRDLEKNRMVYTSTACCSLLLLTHPRPILFLLGFGNFCVISIDSVHVNGEREK